MKKPFESLTKALITQRKVVHDTCRQFSKSPSKGNLSRVKGLFNHCGEDVFIEAGIHFDYGEQISIGSRSYINVNCTIIDAPKSTEVQVVIGEDCFIGPNVQLLNVSHDMTPEKRLQKHNYADNILLGNNVWLGAGVIVLAGVRIGENTVVGAGSVVTKSLESDCFYAGNPAVKIREL
ncbi:MAG: sugar O-acetyltransferase [Colwellia sp.]